MAKDVLHLSAHADPQAIEKKLCHLMRGGKSEIFSGLIFNPPTTVDEFVMEATTMERALQVRARHYQRYPGLSSLAISKSDLRSNLPDIRDIIRKVIQEELKKLLPTAARPASLSIAKVVPEEVQRGVQPEAPTSVAAPEEPTLTYATMVRRAPPAPCPYIAPTRREPP